MGREMRPSVRAWALGTFAAGAVAVMLGASGCQEYGVPAGTSPHREFNFLDMGDQPKVKAQRGDLMGGPSWRTPPGAIPLGFEPYPYKGQPDLAGEKLRNPMGDDSKVVERGKLMFERYCVPCHDKTGAGRGKVVEKGFPPPPSLLTQKVRDWSDGRIFHVVTDGQNIMPSYATQILPKDRWAVVRYVRALQSKQTVAPSTEPVPSESAPAGSGSSVPVDSAAPSASSAPAPASSAPVGRRTESSAAPVGRGTASSAAPVKEGEVQ